MTLIVIGLGIMLLWVIILLWVVLFLVAINKKEYLDSLVILPLVVAIAVAGSYGVHLWSEMTEAYGSFREAAASFFLEGGESPVRQFIFYPIFTAIVVFFVSSGPLLMIDGWGKEVVERLTNEVRNAPNTGKSLALWMMLAIASRVFEYFFYLGEDGDIFSLSDLVIAVFGSQPIILLIALFIIVLFNLMRYAKPIPGSIILFLRDGFRLYVVVTFLITFYFLI